jgi:ATP-dependent Lon protease
MRPSRALRPAWPAWSRCAVHCFASQCVVGEVTLGGTIEPVHNAVSLAELAVEKGAKALLLPVAARRQLFELSDDMATKLDIEFYQDARDALLKALAE